MQQEPLLEEMFQPDDAAAVLLARTDDELPLAVAPENPRKKLVEPVLLTIRESDKSTIFVKTNITIVQDDVTFASFFVNQQPPAILFSHSEETFLGHLPTARGQSRIRRLSIHGEAGRRKPEADAQMLQSLLRSGLFID